VELGYVDGEGVGWVDGRGVGKGREGCRRAAEGRELCVVKSMSGLSLSMKTQTIEKKETHRSPKFNLDGTCLPLRRIQFPPHPMT